VFTCKTIFLEIVRNFFQVLPGHGWSENRIPNKSDPDPDPKSDPEPESEAVSSLLVRKPNNCSQFDQEAAVTAATCAAQAAVSLACSSRIPNNCYQLWIPGTL
jgi:hypothetical protein